MICLTGDVHHATLRTNDQKYADCGEVEAARTYVQIAARHDLKITMFVTGKAFLEKPEILRDIAQQPHVEIGGHTWTAFSPDLLYRGFGFVFGTHCGPAPWQRREIRKTLDLAEHITGTRPVAWRDHAYIRDDNTPGLLAQAGVRVLSDEVASTKTGPEPMPEGVVSLPINVVPDHEHLYHAHRTPERVAQRAQDTPGDFPSESYTPAEWLDQATQQIERIDAAGGVATILAHPLCMYLADRFETFEKLCDRLATKESVFAGQAAHLCPATTDG